MTIRCRGRRIPHVVAAAMLLTAGLCPCARAATVESGHFAGTNVTAMPGTPARFPTAEPAAVLVLNPDAGSLDVAGRFDTWFRQPHQYTYPIFVILELAPDSPVEIVEEAVTQRALKVPVYRTNSNLLGGEPYRIMLLRKGEPETVQDWSPEVLEQRMNDIAAQAGLVPAAGPQDAAQTSAAVELKKGTYHNKRFRFRVRFPDGYGYQAARNGDGAVARPPEGSKLDLRTWAVENQVDAEGKPGSMSMPDYLRRHLAFIADDTGATVNLEKKLVVNDNYREGRDYTYSYTKGGKTFRGRLQVFEVDGVFKVTGAEGTAEEFGARSGLIEKFFTSFEPYPEE